jgi:hemerythrin-like metal-binding protein
VSVFLETRDGSWYDNADSRTDSPGGTQVDIMKQSDYIAWKAEYSVSVTEIDNQHKELLNLVNDSLSHCTGDLEAERQFFFRIMRNVTKYMQRHFDSEEEKLEKNRYAELENHRTEHKNMIRNISAMIDEVVSGRKELDLYSMTLFIRDWILDHIPNFDRPAAEFFRD